MIQRIVSVWVAIGSATAVSFLCHTLAGEAGRPIEVYIDGVLPLISRIFYRDAPLIYLYPVPLGIWALYLTVRCREDRDQSLLLITATMGISIIFIAVFTLAIVLPYIPGAPSLMR